MLKFLIKLGQEYLVTETITRKPGPIIKGPGYRILNPFTQASHGMTEKRAGNLS